MDDYHKFKGAHESQIEKWHLYWSPNYVFIMRVPMISTTSSATTTTLTNSNAMSGKSNAIGSGGISTFTNTQDPLLTFNLIVEFL